MTHPTERTYPLTRPDSHSLRIDTPIMNAAGTLGFGDEYAALIDLDKLGAFVTNPMTWSPRSPSSGTRVIPIDGGALMHTGLPNPGLHKVCQGWRNTWERLGVPIIAHVIAKSVDEVRRCMERLEEEDCIVGMEFGLHDDDPAAASARLIKAAVDGAEKPVIARLPFGGSVEYAQAVIDAGAGGVVVSAPPRGTARDAAGRWVGGRVYSPLIHTLTLRQVGQMTRALDVPVIAAGGIYTPDDAREFLEAGAAAVQFDAVAWINPAAVNVIVRDLSGGTVTQAIGAAEWHPGMTETERAEQMAQQATKPDKRPTPSEDR